MATLHAVILAVISGLSLWVLYILITDPQNSHVMWIALSTLALTILRIPVLSCKLSISYGLAFELGEKLRATIIDHLQKLSLGMVRNHKSGYLVGLFNDDVKWIEAFIGGGACMAIGALLVPFFLLLGIFYIDLKLAIILTICILSGLPVLYFYNRILVSGVKERTMDISALSSRIGEHFAGMNVLRSFNAEGVKDKYFRQDLQNLVSKYKKAALKMAPLSVFGLFLMEVGIAFAAYYGVQDAQAGNIPAYIVVFALLLALSLYNPLLLFFGGSGLYRLAESSSVNINKFLDLPGQQTKIMDIPKKSDFSLSFNDVSFSYGDGKPAVSNINFTAEHGQVTAIVGPSGAGKSTLFNLASRYWDVDGGEISIGRRDVQTIPVDELSTQLSIVTQDTILINESIKRNIDLGLSEYTDAQIEEAVQLARCSDFIDANSDGLNAQVGEDGVRLSGGQKQRITIARALLNNAPIILLDEATSSVDPTNARIIHDCINTLTEDKTVIVIGHRLSLMKDADKIIVLNEGRVASEGTHDSLLEYCDIYKQLWSDHQSCKRWAIGS